MEALHYFDFPEEVQLTDSRTWCMQMLIVKNGNIFIQNDLDSADRFEAQVVGNEVTLPAMTARLNSMSGGKKKGETVLEGVIREMNEELGIQGKGKTLILSEMPLVSCYQEKEIGTERKGMIMAGMLVIYEPTDEEISTLSNQGNWVDIDKSLVDAQDDPELFMRPAFRTALQLAKLADRDGVATEVIEQWVTRYNRMIVEFARQRCQENNITLHCGIFSEELWSQNL